MAKVAPELRALNSKEREFIHQIVYQGLPREEAYASVSEMEFTEDNKKKIENLKIENLDKTCSIMRLTKISTIEKMLEESGSDVKAPQKPAYRIK